MREQELIVYREFEDGDLLYDMAWLMEHYADEYYNQEDKAALMYDCIHKLIELAGTYGFHGNLWHCYLANLLVNNENSYSKACEIRGKIEGTINEAVLHDITIIKEFFDYDFTVMIQTLDIKGFAMVLDYTASIQESKVYNSRIRDRICTLAERFSNARTPQDMKEFLTEFYQDYGVGKFGLHKAFRVEHTDKGVQIVPILNIAHVHLNDLVGYEIPKKKLVDNTEAFVYGRKANNCLLFGDAGTGKSSSIKAIANQYYEDGLRIIAAALTTDDRLLLEFENTTNEDIYFSLENFTVNGILLNNFPANSPYESETIVANTHLIIETAIMPPKLVKDCFSIASIADVTFSVDIDWSVMKNSASISIPSRDATIDTSGIQVCKYENINITYKGLYCTKTSEYNIDENPYDVYYEDDDNYELLLYVENGNPEEILIELEALFLDYEKIDFSTYETYGRDNRYWNFGTVPAGYCGYIKLKLDTKSMQDNYMCDISSISEIEMKILFKESLSEDILASEWVSFSVS